MSLTPYLPEPAEINACIKPEAEGASEAVLLAVHRPTPISYREVNRTEPTPTTEQALIDHILTENVPTGSLVVPITGISGVGKSHLVRVIDARIRQRDHAERFLVIRIPKSASLRRVVELILEPLKGSEYDGAREAFARAMGEVDESSASIHFRAHIIVALERYAKTLEEQIRQGQPNLRQKLDHAKRLPLLFDDPVTSGHFQSTAFPRLVRRAVAGADQEDLDVLSGQFKEEDLNLPTSINLDLAAQRTKIYYTQAVNAFGGRGRRDAVDVLNAVVDEATRDLFKLQNVVGGKTLHEIILDIRSLILGKQELVLLIEDFAALTGIQETLSKVLIQEGVRDNRAVYATMRSVIAVTDGWTIGRETIATRAEREWIVESKIASREEILALTRAMVSSYLNAARWGHEALLDRYKARGRNGKRHWVGVFGAEDDDASDAESLAAFGFEDEVPLFPFTSTAIDYLAADVLREGDRLVFNPRLIINQILRRILLPARQAFEQQVFPPAEIRCPPASAEIAHWLAEQPEALRPRYLRVAVVWGNNPQALDDLADISGRVFTSFGLPAPAIKRDRAKPKPKPEPSSVVDLPKDKQRDKEKEKEELRTTEEDLRIGKFQRVLEAWVQRGERLQQSTANAIRKEVAAALNAAIDLNALRCRDFDIDPNEISIPNAAGEGGTAAEVVSITDDLSDSDGRLRKALLALYRSRVVYDGARDYAEIEDDLARACNFVDGLVPKALALLKRRVDLSVAALVGPVVMAGRVLGIADRGKSVKAVHQYLLQPADKIEEAPEDIPPPLQDWRKFQAECFETRRTLQSHLFNACGCFQGEGKKVLAVDILRLVEALRAERTDGDPLGLSPEDVGRVKALAETKIRARARAALRALSSEVQEVEEELGGSFDKGRTLSSVRVLAEAISSSGDWSTDRIGIGYQGFKELCNAFEESAVKESLALIGQGASEDDDPAKAILKAGQVQLGPVFLATRFVHRARALVRYAESHVQLLERQYADINPEAESAVLLREFEELKGRLGALSQGGVNGAT